MTVAEIQIFLHQISLDLVKYEDGDLLFVSDLIDSLETIKANFTSHPALIKIFSGMNLLLQLLLSGEDYRKLGNAISLGVDLLTRFVMRALRENKTLQDLPEGEIGDIYGEEINKFIMAVEKATTARKCGRKERQDETVGERELELRVTSEPFKVFLSEAEEKIIRGQELILGLEEAPENKAVVNELFRIFHTIKGECGFLRIASLGELAHNLENLLDLMREDKLPVDTQIIDILLAGIDYAKNMLDALRKGEIIIFGQISIRDYILKINTEIQRIKVNIGEILLEQGKLSEAEVGAILQKQKETSFTKKFGEIAVEENYITAEELRESLSDQQKPRTDAAGVEVEKSRDSIIKVKASQINYLVDMVGELLITETQLDDRVQNLSPLKKITAEIQYAAMQLRTEKVKNLFIMMKRVVRDAARKLGKRVVSVVRGEDLEIDRDLVEKLEEPLMHIIRNSVSHGIESETERLARGKIAEGRILIEAERRGNTIAISVEDDGGGLDRDKILSKAVEKGLVFDEGASVVSDNDVYNFIFVQGFSTAENIDYVSGRGVGMDIVKTVTTGARGRVEIKTEKGKFTRIEMIFPLSTAIIDGMIVRDHGLHYIIPVSNVIESIKVESKQIFIVKDEVEVIDLRGEIIPVIRLSDYFAQNEVAGEADKRRLAVIVENNEKKKCALLLDEIITKREVFIKALGGKFRDLRGISSGTILQGGKIGFVLDVDQISQVVDGRERSVVPTAPGSSGMNL